MLRRILRYSAGKEGRVGLHDHGTATSSDFVLQFGGLLIMKCAALQSTASV